MIILSIDPGEMTGFVAYDDAAGYISDIRTDTLPAIASLLFDYKAVVPKAVLYERMPEQAINKQLIHDYMVMQQNAIRICDLVVPIFPGNWKPLSEARKWRQPLARTPHESDAYNMLRYWILRETKKDIGESKPWSTKLLY